jgi:hypothetical protein
LSNTTGDLSANGRYVVWAANRNLPTVNAPSGINADGNYEIFWLDRSSGVVRQLTQTLGGDEDVGAHAANLWPRVTRDGSRIVFMSNRELTGTAVATNRYGIFVADAQGHISRLTSASIPVERAFPAFGINDVGTRLIFASDANLTGENPEGNFEIFLCDLHTGHLTQVTETPSAVANVRPILSGDAKKAAFLSNADFVGLNADGSQELWVYHFDADRTYADAWIQVTRLAVTPGAREGRKHWMDWYSLDSTGARLVMCTDADLTRENATQEYEIFLCSFEWDPEPEVWITEVRQANNDLVLQWQGNRSNLVYLVESCETMVTAPWATVAPTSQWWTVTTTWTNSGISKPSQFYRIRGKEQ